MAKSDLPTYEQAFGQVLDSLDGPISTDDFIARVWEIRPLQAKRPRNAVRSKFPDFEYHSKLVRLTPQTIIPARLVMQGVRFVAPLSAEEIKHGLVHLYPGFAGLFNYYHRNPENIQFSDVDGDDLPVKIVNYSVTMDNPVFGEQNVTRKSFDLKAWFTKVKAQANDYIIFTILDWDKRHIRLDLETAANRAARADEVESQNKAITNALFAMLEAEANEDLITGKALPAMYARIPNPQGYPGDPWWLLVDQDPRMKSDGV